MFSNIFILSIPFWFIVLALPVKADSSPLTGASANNAKQLPKIVKKKINVRLQYRRHLHSNRIEDESDYQVTMFGLLPGKFFLFMDTEFIFSDTDYYSTISEFNISRSFSLRDKYWGCLDWITRVQLETDRKSDLSAGIQWHLTKTPILSPLTKKIGLKLFVQFFPLKTTTERGYADAYLYYSFPLPGGFSYCRGFGRYFWGNDDGGSDYRLLVQDIIFPVSKEWDIYIRFSHHSTERNDGVGIGVRYLLKF